MNTKKFALSFVAVYVVNRVLSYLIHEFWLAEPYAAVTEIWRPELMSKMWIMLITSAFWCFFFCYLFVRGYEGRGIMEGVRFGAIIGLFYAIPHAYEQYVIFPVPYHLAMNWFIAGMVTSILGGIVVALIYKPDNP